jgi:CRP/FNR family transcriptional regulator, cyclic AMP receptor protein
LIGEIGIFAPKQTRVATVKCRTDCTVFELTEQKTKELYFQDRSFGFAVLQLIIARLVEHNEQLMQAKAS